MLSQSFDTQCNPCDQSRHQPHPLLKNRCLHTIVSSPDPTYRKRRNKGLVTVEGFFGSAESAFQWQLPAQISILST